MKNIFNLLCFVLLSISCQAQELPQEVKSHKVYQPVYKAVPTQFRAVWVATVKNMDWPSKPGLPMAQQMKEAIAYLDQAVALNFNAIIFQVRPHCDAFYRSPYEPWSYYLSGQEGKDPGYDPLQFWITEAHKRGLELHAWFNPFRSRYPAMKGRHSPKSIAARRPHWNYTLKNGYEWLDPGRQEVRDFLKDVIMDVLKRYDVDGIHLDDYFYPYPEYSANGEFPDWKTYQGYKGSGGNLSHKDWRRNNINLFVHDLHQSIKATRRPVRFGISPFGIWRPNYPKGIKGLDVYDVLSADSKKWLNQGWVDYLAPQLYWSNKSTAQNFTRLVDWWSQQNYKGKDIFPGLACYKVEKWSDGPQQIVDQLKIIESRPSVRGFIHFNMRTISNSLSIQKALKNYHRTPAHIPPFKGFLFAGKAENVKRKGNILTWETNSRMVRRWVVLIGKSQLVLPSGSRQLDLSKYKYNGKVHIAAIGPSGVVGSYTSISQAAY